MFGARGGVHCNRQQVVEAEPCNNAQLSPVLVHESVDTPCAALLGSIGLLKCQEKRELHPPCSVEARAHTVPRHVEAGNCAQSQRRDVPRYGIRSGTSQMKEKTGKTGRNTGKRGRGGTGRNMGKMWENREGGTLDYLKH